MDSKETKRRNTVMFDALWLSQRIGNSNQNQRLTCVTEEVEKAVALPIH